PLSSPATMRPPFGRAHCRHCRCELAGFADMATPRILASWPLAQPIIPLDKILQPHGAVRAGDALRTQGARPVACLWLVIDVAAALRDDREEQVDATRLEVEFAIDSGIDIEQPHAFGESLAPFPDPLNIDDPCMLDCLDDLALEDILGALEALSRRDLIAGTPLRDPGSQH